jgi:hypothetical protein
VRVCESRRCVRPPVSAGAEGQPGHAINRQELLDQTCISIESARDFTRVKRKLVSHAAKRSGQRTRMAATAPDAILLFFHCHF